MGTPLAGAAASRPCGFVEQPWRWSELPCGQTTGQGAWPCPFRLGGGDGSCGHGPVRVLESPGAYRCGGTPGAVAPAFWADVEECRPRFAGGRCQRSSLAGAGGTAGVSLASQGFVTSRGEVASVGRGA